MPKSLRSAATLFERAAGTPNKPTMAMVHSAAVLRCRPKRSVRMAAGTSRIESMAPTLAMAVRMKKSVMKIAPPGIEVNTAGMVMKTNEGPAEGSKPKENTAGKMAMPASSETVRSASMTRVVVAGMFWSSRK